MKSHIAPAVLAQFLLLTLAGSASTLSCLPPDAVRLYTQVRDSDEVFGIVIGRLHPEGEIAIPEVPATGNAPDRSEATTRVRMTGRVLGENGFEQSFDSEVDVKVTCLSVWCGQPITDREILAALRVTGGVPELEVGPCGGNQMPSEDADLKGLLECHATGKCGE